MSIFLKALLAIMVAIPNAVCWGYLFGKLYGAIVAAVCLLLMILGLWHRRRRKITEAEMLRRIDKAMGKPSDDPRQMARYVP